MNKLPVKIKYPVKPLITTWVIIFSPVDNILMLAEVFSLFILAFSNPREPSDNTSSNLNLQW